MIYHQQVQSMVDYLEQHGLSEASLSDLRQQFDGIHFTYCMDDDVNISAPYMEAKHFNVYLVDSREHCSKLTSDAKIASGIVFAEVIDD